MTSGLLAEHFLLPQKTAQMAVEVAVEAARHQLQQTLAATVVQPQPIAIRALMGLQVSGLLELEVVAAVERLEMAQLAFLELAAVAEAGDHSPLLRQELPVAPASS